MLFSKSKTIVKCEQADTGTELHISEATSGICQIRMAAGVAVRRASRIADEAMRELCDGLMDEHFDRSDMESRVHAARRAAVLTKA